jgi:TP901 family phage tail tape measure protein
VADLALTFDILARDRASGPFNAAGRSAEKTGGKFAKFGKLAASGMAVAGVAVAAFVAKGVKDAIELDTKLREINTLFGLTGKEAEASFSNIQQVVKGVSKEVGIAQKTIAEGLYNAISAGVPRDNVFEFMKVASKAAIAGVTDTNTAVNGLTTVINAFGLSSRDAGKVADSLFTAVKGGKTTFREMSDALFNVAPAAAASKVSFQEVNAAIATLTASGTPTSVATTQIRAALTGLQKPSKDLDKIFRDLGFTNAQTAIESKGLGFALDAVKKASGGNNGALQKLLGSTEAVAAANVLAGTGAAKFKAELDAQKGSAGATDKAFAEMEKSVSRQIERLKVNMQNLGIEIGQKVLPFINAALDGFLGKTGNADSASYKFGQTLRGFADFVNNTVIPAVKKFTEEFRNGEGAGGKIRETFEKFKKTLEDNRPQIEQVGRALVQVGEFIATKVIPVLVDLQSNRLRLLIETFGAVITVIKTVQTTILGMVGTFLGALGQVFTVLAKVPGPFQNNFREAAAAVSGAKKTVDNLKAAINAVPAKKVDVKANVIGQDNLNNTTHTIQALKNKQVAVTIVTTNIQRTIREGQQATGRGLGARAEGGPVRAGQPYIVGEREPELFVPRVSGQILNQRQMRDAGIGEPPTAAGNTYNMNIAGPLDPIAVFNLLKRTEMLYA